MNKNTKSRKAAIHKAKLAVYQPRKSKRPKVACLTADGRRLGR